MQSLVTGGAGFLGSHLCDRLLAEGNDVVCLDNLSTGRLVNISHLESHPRFQFIEHDVAESLPALPMVDRIYHLASPASPPAYQRLALETMRANSEGTWNLLNLARESGARLLFASTSEVYGDPLEHPQQESYRGNVNTIGPRSMYDEAKRFGETLVVVATSTYGLDTRIARIFNTYGPRMAPEDGRVVSNFVVQAIRGAPLTIYGDGTQTRSFQYVDDTVDGLIRLMESSYTGPVNIGNPAELTVLEFATLVQKLTHSQSRIELCPLPGDDPKLRKPDISLAKSVLGWEPRTTIEVGMAITVDAIRQEIGTLEAQP